MTRMIGIDVDGVIGNHRKIFADVLKRVSGKEINPDSITKIPVHQCFELGVTKDQELLVFNRRDYWEEMPVYPEAAERIHQVRNVLGLQVYIFTHRPWPDLATLDLQSGVDAWRPLLSLIHI